ncbi:3672_t:CDS:2 [Ambispora gerdemannii]|uniref:3672_t:CDS:1 n=1 Tax=Ambispora gerdemannii TaxID=144530 RepID=A0A9N9E966_9GLOM|nr:3672_t:CDS:2 [Ambispora gerdemannii]
MTVIKNFSPLSLQILLLLLYPATVILGSIYWTIARPPPSYFSKKSNIFNVWLVKNENTKKARWKAAIRWFLATAYWFIITQWFFGPSIIDQVFLWTGGECIKEGAYMIHTKAYACKTNGGRWIGGHDVSGHCFLLIHASLFLCEEFSIVAYRYRDFRPVIKTTHKMVTRALLFLLGVWWWMLFMTGIFFHNLNEKLTGSLFGVLYWIVMYGVVFPNYVKSWMPYDISEVVKNGERINYVVDVDNSNENGSSKEHHQ